MSFRGPPAGRPQTVPHSPPQKRATFSMLASGCTAISASNPFQIQSLLVPQTHMPCGRNNQPVVPRWKMSGRSGWVWSFGLRFSTAIAALGMLCAHGFVASLAAQERREREPNSVYAERRAKLAAQVDGPVILWGLTGREESAQTHVFHQEDSFYYLTGHNEEGAGLIILPPPNDKEGLKDSDWWGPTRECLFLPAKDSAKEKWNGVRMSPADPGI